MSVQPFPTATIVAQDTANDADSVSGLVTRAGSCVGVLGALTEDTGTNIPFAFSGVSARTGSHFWNSNNLENLAALTAANCIFAGTSGNIPTGTLGFDVTLPGGFDGRGIEIRQPSSTNRIAKTFGDGFHSSSAMCRLATSEFGRLEVEMMTNRVFATRGLNLIGELFEARDVADTDPQERYHTSTPLFMVTGGFVVFGVDHNKRVYMLKSATFDGLVSASSTPVTPSGEAATYIDGGVDDQGTILFQSRLRVPGSPLRSWLLLTKVVDPMGSATVSNIYVANGAGGRQPYPRGLRFDGVFGGKRLWIGHMQIRNESAPQIWLAESSYVYNETDNTIFDLAKVDRTTGTGADTSSGLTSNVAMFGDPALNPTGSYTRTGNGFILVASNGWAPTGQRYISDICGGKIVGDESGWTRADVIFAFIDRTGTDPLAYGAADVRLMLHKGATAIATAAAANPLGLNTPYSYRVPIIFLPDGDDMIVWAIDQKTDGIMSTSPADFYYNGFGGDGHLRKRVITNWQSATDAASLIAAISTPSGWTDVELPEVCMNIKPIIGMTAHDVYLDVMMRDSEATAPRGINQTAQQGAFWSPNQDLTFEAPSAGGRRSRSRSRIAI